MREVPEGLILGPHDYLLPDIKVLGTLGRGG